MHPSLQDGDTYVLYQRTLSYTHLCQSSTVASQIKHTNSPLPCTTKSSRTCIYKMLNTSSICHTCSCLTLKALLYIYKKRRTYSPKWIIIALCVHTQHRHVDSMLGGFRLKSKKITGESFAKGLIFR